MKDFCNRLGASFYFGLLLLVCVAVGATAGVVGHYNGRQEVINEFTRCSQETPAVDVTKTNDGHVCEHCRQSESLIDRLRDKLAEAQYQLAEARKARLENKLEQIDQQLDAQTATVEQPPQRIVASAGAQWPPASPQPTPMKPDDQKRGGLLRFRLR